MFCLYFSLQILASLPANEPALLYNDPGIEITDALRILYPALFSFLPSNEQQKKKRKKKEEERR